MKEQEAKKIIERWREGSFEQGENLSEYMKIVKRRFFKLFGVELKWDSLKSFVEQIRSLP